MGKIASRESVDILEKLDLFEEGCEGPLGRVNLFRVKDPPYEYVMEFKRSYIQSGGRLEREAGLLRRLKNIEHPNLARIWQCDIRQEEQLCIKHQTLYIYANYYNFTLKQAVEIKKRTRHWFSEGDLLYLASSLISVALELSKYQIVKANYRLSELFLSPEGYLKLYLLEADPDNRHSCYYTVLTERERLSEFLLAPEQLHSLKKLQLQARFDPFKADLYAIGLVLVQLITLDSAQFYYNLEMGEVMTAKLNFVIDSYAHRYSTNFLFLLKAILEPQPTKRIKMEEVNQHLAHLIDNEKKKVHCIRLESESNQKDQNLQFKGISSGFMNISSKLTPKPISMLSSTSNSRPLISTRPSIRRMTNEP